MTVRQDPKTLEQVNDLVRVVNQVNTTSFKNKLPLHIPVKDTGSYTVGLMDTRDIELISTEDKHVELIDSTVLSFYESPVMTDYIKEHLNDDGSAVSFNAELDVPLSDGTMIIYITAFRADTKHPAVIAQLDRQPTYYAIIGTSLNSVEECFMFREYEELCGDE